VTVLLALAFQRSDNLLRQVIGSEIRSVSRSPGNVVRANDFRAAKPAGNDGFDYQGASGAILLNEALEPLCLFEVIRIFDGTRQRNDR
jgi:hypothetical protein